MLTLEKLFFFLTLLAALGSGLIAGVFFIFSVAIMRALERVPGGMAAMQSINVVIINPMFLGVFMGTAVLCVAVLIGAVVRWDLVGSAWLLAGAILYLIGSIGVTMVVNVPLNNGLAAVTPRNSEGVWANYLSTWTFWNHFRTVSSLAASANFILALGLGL